MAELEFATRSNDLPRCRLVDNVVACRKLRRHRGSCAFSKKIFEKGWRQRQEFFGAAAAQLAVHVFHGAGRTADCGTAHSARAQRLQPSTNNGNAAGPPPAGAFESAQRHAAPAAAARLGAGLGARLHLHGRRGVQVPSRQGSALHTILPPTMPPDVAFACVAALRTRRGRVLHVCNGAARAQVCPNGKVKPQETTCAELAASGYCGTSFGDVAPARAAERSMAQRLH